MLKRCHGEEICARHTSFSVSTLRAVRMLTMLYQSGKEEMKNSVLANDCSSFFCLLSTFLFVSRSLKNGNVELGVHIADVSFFVKAGSHTDREARER